MANIIIKELKKSFGNKTVLDGLNMTVGSAEIVCLVGMSGSGKSVTLKLIAGLLSQDSGEITIGQKTISKNEGVNTFINSKIGFLFQGAALFDSMSIYDNVAFGLRRAGYSEDYISGVVREMLNAVGLPNAGMKRPSELSGGMQKRAALARSIALRPDIMLYDEPTTGVDPIAGGSVDRLIARMRDMYGVTSLVVTHDISSTLRIADRVTMLHGGRAVFNGDREEFKSAEDLTVRQFAEGRSDAHMGV
jgi:phospholipid/cholesterol/gamma-HCH transport system ATP-binding protein